MRQIPEDKRARVASGRCDEADVDDRGGAVVDHREDDERDVGFEAGRDCVDGEALDGVAVDPADLEVTLPGQPSSTYRSVGNSDRSTTTARRSGRASRAATARRYRFTVVESVTAISPTAAPITGARRSPTRSGSSSQPSNSQPRMSASAHRSPTRVSASSPAFVQIGAREPGMSGPAFRVALRLRGVCRAHDRQDRGALFDIGIGQGDLAVETPGAQECRIEHIGAIGRRQHDDVLVALKAVHLDQDLIQRLFTLVVRAAPGHCCVCGRQHRSHR